jgi:hypothetical protein
MKKRFTPGQGSVLVKSVLALMAFCVLLALTGCENPASGHDEAPTLTGTVSVTGLTRLGETLQAVTIALDGEGALSYQWLRGTTAIPGAGTTAYILEGADQGEMVKVRVSRAGYSGSVESEAVGPVDGGSFTSLEEITAYLKATPMGANPDNPAYVPVQMQLSNENWIALLDTFDDAEAYVTLDLSGSTKGEQSSDGGLYADGTFDPNLLGSAYIAKLILPRDAESIKDGYSANYPTFGQFTNLREIRAENVHTVGAHAFYSRTGLTSVDLPAATDIKNYAFGNCGSLVTVKLPAALTVNNNAFRDCISLTAISLPAATSVNSAFYGCTGLVTADLPEVALIYDNTFYGCINLTAVIIPKATTIAGSAFSGCTNLVSLSLPVFLATVVATPSPFSGCVNLTGITVASANSKFSARNGMLLDKSGANLIAYPSANGDLVLDNTITEVGNYAFSGNTALTTVSIPKAASIAANAFYGCANLTAINFPETTTIGAGAFYECANLSSAYFPQTTTIGANAFYGCTALAEIDFSSARTFGNNAFRGCTSPSTEIKFGTVPPIFGNTTFRDVSQKIVTVLVPSSAASDYDSSWKTSLNGGNNNITVNIETYSE